MEQWKKLKNYEIYEISNYGNIKSIDRIDKIGRFKKGKILKKYIGKSGYYYACLCKNGSKKNATIHRLVAQAFIENKNNFPVVNHIDGDKLNNNVNNLEWCSQKDNIKHSWENGLSHKTRCKKIIQKDLNNKIIKIFNSTMDAERETGINNSKIVACCKKKYGRKTAGGFKWEYFENSNI